MARREREAGPEGFPRPRRREVLPAFPPRRHGFVPVPLGVRRVHRPAQQRCLRGRGGGAAGGGELGGENLGGGVRGVRVEEPPRAEPPVGRRGGGGLGVPGGHPQLLLLARAGGARVPGEVQGENLQRILVPLRRRQQGPRRRLAGGGGPGGSGVRGTGPVSANRCLPCRRGPGARGEAAGRLFNLVLELAALAGLSE